jgi:hypothetical protein
MNARDFGGSRPYRGDLANYPGTVPFSVFGGALCLADLPLAILDRDFITVPRRSIFGTVEVYHSYPAQMLRQRTQMSDLPLEPDIKTNYYIDAMCQNREAHSEHFSTALPQKPDEVLHRGERQLRATTRHSWHFRLHCKEVTDP